MAEILTHPLEVVPNIEQQLLNTIEVEETQYDYLAEQFKRMSKACPPVYRVGIPGVDGRFYVTFDPEGRPSLLTTGTTIISDGYSDPFKARILSDWRTSMILKGQNPDLYTQYRADYGTIMHVLFGHLLQGKAIPMYEMGGQDSLEQYIRELDLSISETSLQYVFKHFRKELKKDILSFLQWIKDYKVRPLAIELMGCYPRYKVGSAIDLVCTLEDRVEGYWGEVYKTDGHRGQGYKKGDPKKSWKTIRVLAIVDFKSGKKGFYNSHILQLYLYRRILEEQFGVVVDATYNFAPSDWRTKPAYKFVRQDDRAIGDRYFEDVMSQGMKKFEDKPKKFSMFVGHASIKDGANTVQYHHFDLLTELYRKYCPEFLHELQPHGTGGQVADAPTPSEPVDEELQHTMTAIMEKISTMGEGQAILLLSKQNLPTLKALYKQAFSDVTKVENLKTKKQLVEAIKERILDGEDNMEAPILEENPQGQVS